MPRTRSWLRWVVASLLVLGVASAAWAGLPLEHAAAGHHGIAAVRAPAHRHASVDVFLAFNCRQCSALYAAEPELKRTYGHRITVVNHYAAASLSASAPLRLYLVAKFAGKGDAAASLLMSERLDTRSENESLVLVAWSATQLGLRTQYDASFDDHAMTETLARVVRSSGKRVAHGPSATVNRRRVAPANIAGVRQAINSALHGEQGADRKGHAK